MSETLVIELVMHAVRLARTGNYLRLAQLRAALQKDFPDVEPAQISEALRQLALRYQTAG